MTTLFILEEGLFGRGWLIHFSKGNGISYHKDLGRLQSGKAQVQKVGGHAAKDQMQIQTSSWGIKHPESVHTKFYIRFNLMFSTCKSVNDNFNKHLFSHGSLYQ